MKMVRIKDGHFVAADQVAEVSVIESRDGVRVRMKDGQAHWVPNDYGQSAWSTCDRLVKLVDSELHRGQDQ